MIDTITVKDIQYEVFQDYKKPSMLIAMCKCDWKCAIENGFDKTICQNLSIAKQADITITIDELCKKYLLNLLTKAIIFGGLEPILQLSEIEAFIYTLREKFKCSDDIVIYTGYNPWEIESGIAALSQFKNIIMKYGRYDPKLPSRYDEVLGITLISNNQYAERIS